MNENETKKTETVETSDNRPATKPTDSTLGGIMPDFLDRETSRPATAYDASRVRRRKPKRYRFLIAMIIYAAAALLIIGTLTCIGWKYVSLRQDAAADTFVNDLVINTDTDSWRQLLDDYFPKSYVGCEDGEKLAKDILSPNFTVGKVTFTRLVAAPDMQEDVIDVPDLPTYRLFSDGEPFAYLSLSDKDKALFDLGEWKIDKIYFDLGYFTHVDFPVTTVIVPENAKLAVNGSSLIPGKVADMYVGSCVKNGIAAAVCSVNEDAEYPAVTPGEYGQGPACLAYCFYDLYFAPELEAELDGVKLTLCRDDENRTYYFEFPENYTHSLTLTAPESVTVKVGDAVVTEEWASRASVEAELGDKDAGGTGERPMLNVWTVCGIFGEPEVSAEVGGRSLKIISSDNGNYVFEIPDECKYTVTVIVPHGATVAVNGKTASASDMVPAGATAEEIGRGSTVLGKYEVSELAALPEIIPAFDKYVFSGYVAVPNVTVTYEGRELEPCGSSANEYALLREYDFTGGDTPDENRLKDARDFAAEYIRYVCDGGAWEDKSNQAVFDANYNALKGRMVAGTTGYVSVMESYREVNKLPHHESFTIDKTDTDGYIRYSDGCVSCRVTYTVTRSRTVNGEKITETVDGSMRILQVVYRGEWRVWGFVSE